MTSGQEMEWVYSYNPGARTGRTIGDIEDKPFCQLRALLMTTEHN